MRRIATIAAVAVLGAFMAPAWAQGTADTIWRCRDKEGHTHVTNLKSDTVGKDCRAIRQQRVTVVPAQAAPKSPPKSSGGGAAREDGSQRTSAKERQRQILDKELAAEEGLLAAAREELAEQEAVRTGDEKNYARVLERLQPYRDNVEVHQKNVEALKRELRNLDR